jgi:copper chaperone CopZ
VAAAPGELTTELAVTGMHCGSCSALIQESLADTTGVSRAEVDLDSGRAVVAFDPSQVDTDRLLSVVAEAGYSATPVG